MVSVKVHRSTSQAVRFVPVVAVAALLLVAIGCGGGSGSSAGTIHSSAFNATQVRMGDAPADRVVSFEVTIGPVSLTPSGGSPTTVLSGTRRLELTHLSGSSEPLALLNIPAGSYTSASIMVSNPEVTFLNSANVLQELQPALSQTITLNFSPALSVTAGSSVVDFDLNVANSLTFDNSGNVTGVNLSASSFSVSTSAVAVDRNNEQEDDGELEDTVGMVTGVNGSSFTITVGQNGVPLTFSTDANTQFSDGAALGTMLNTIVKVEGATLTDGSLYAKEVEGMESSTGAEAEGLITKVTGNPATQLTVVAQDGLGNGLDNSKIGTTLTANVSGAGYKVSKGNIDTSGLSGLPNPTFPFDATSIHAGQSVELESASGVTNSSVTAETVQLQQQGLSGTVSGLAGPTTAGPVTFTLTVPSDSAFAQLSGKTAIMVFWQPGTDLHHLTSVNNNDTVRVRGLVFFTSTGVNMIARRIGQ